MNPFHLLSLLTLIHSYTQWSLSLSNSQIQQKSSYTFSLQLSNQVTTSSYLLITFPNDYSQSSLSSCTCSNVFQLNSSLKCTVTNLNVTLNNLYSSALAAGSTIIFKINSITNPDLSKTTDFFTIVSYTESGVIIESLTKTLNVFISPAPLSYFSVEMVNATTAAMTSFVLSSNFSVQVPQGGVILIDFPYWNTFFISNSSDGTDFFSGNLNCTLELNGKNYSESCGVNLNTVNISINTPVFGVFQIFIDSGLAPATLQPVYGVNVSVSQSAGGLMSFTNASVSSAAACLIYPHLLLSTEALNSTSDYTFTMITPTPVSSQTSIKLDFPKEFSVTISNVVNLFGLDTLYPSFSLSGQTVELKNLFTAYKPAGKIISFKLVGVTNPEVSFVSGLFVSLLQNSYLASKSNSLPISFAAEDLKIISILAENPKINSATPFFFNFSAESAIPTSALLYIQVPQEISINTQSLTLSPIHGLSPTSQISSSSNSITITQCFNNTVPHQISFTISNFTTPSSTKPTSAFTFKIFQDSTLTQTLFQDSTFTFTASPGVLSSCIVVPDSYITGTVTSYTFGCVGNMSPGNSFVVQMNSDAYLVLAGSSCVELVGFGQNDGCESTQIQITMQTSEYVSGSFSFKIANVKNAKSVNPTEFSLGIYTADGYLIETSKVSLAMTQPHSFSAVSVLPGNESVSASTYYTINLTVFNPINSSAWILILSDIDLTQVSCAVPYSCEFSNGLKIFINQIQQFYTLNIGPVTNPSSFKPFSFNISSFNPYLQDSSNLKLSLTTPGVLLAVTLTPNNTQILSSVTLSITFIPQHPLSEIDSLSIQFPSTFTNVSFNTQSQPSSTVYIKNPTLPLDFTLTLPTVSGTYPITIQTFQNSYLVDQNYANLTVTCSAPCSSCVNSVNFCTACLNQTPYMSNNYCYVSCPAGENDIGNKTCSPCAAGCAECSSFSNCSNCISGFYLDSQSCVQSCPSSKFDINGECELCSSNCLTCNVSKNNCTSCSIGMFLYGNICVFHCGGVVINSVCYDCQTGCGSCVGLSTNCTSCTSGYLFSSKCYSACPSNTMPYLSTCIQCQSSCSTCESFPNKCTSCYPGSQLQNSSCVSLCPQGFFYTQNTCLQCSSQCLTCQNTSNYCTSCVSGYSYNGLCLPSCPTSTTIESDSSCLDCLPTCQTCLFSISNCDSCSSSLLLFNNSCVANCPLGFFNNSNTCFQCPGNCESCNSSECFQCSNSFVLYQQSCIKTCPLSTFLLNQQCLQCNSSCKSCVNSSNSCTDCISSLVLYQNQCVQTCPTGFVLELRACSQVICGENCTTSLLNNSVCDPECDSSSCQFDNGFCDNPSTQLQVSKEPFSFTTAGVVLGGVGGTSAAISAGSVLASVSPICGVLEFAGWVAIGSQVMQGNKGRRLSEVESDVTVGCFVGIFIIVVAKLFLNMFAVRAYRGLMSGVHREWVLRHYKFSVVLQVCAALFSFKILTLLVSGMLGAKVFSAKFDRPSCFFRILLAYTAISLVFLSVPMLCICLYILSAFPKGSLVYVLTADVLIITVISIFVSILSIFSYNRKMKEQNNGNEMVSVAVHTAIEDFEFGSENFSKPSYEDRYTIIKQYLDNLNAFEKNCIKRKIIKCRSLDLGTELVNQSGLAQSFSKTKLNESFKESVKEEGQDGFREVEGMGSIIINPSELYESEISISDIELEIKPKEDFEFLEIDPEDFEVVRAKFKDIDKVLCLRKSFSDGVFVDEHRNRIEPQPNFEIHKMDLIKVLHENPAIGLFKHKETGEVFWVLRNFANAQIVKDRRGAGNHEFVLNSRRELVENTKVKQGHPLFWKFSDPRIKDRESFA